MKRLIAGDLVTRSGDDVHRITLIPDDYDIHSDVATVICVKGNDWCKIGAETSFVISDLTPLRGIETASD